MSPSPIMRFFLAALLAFWSPGWCCCSLLGRVCTPGAAVASADADSGCCGEKPGAVVETVQSSCCRQPESGPSEQRLPGCGCGDHSRSFDLGPGVFLTASDSISGIISPLALSPDLPAITTQPFGSALSPETDRAAEKVRADSLFARRCLLIV